jgi:hypothetical protein
MRRAYPDLQDDEDAIRESTKEGFSGNGDSNRGIGDQS